MPSLSAESPSRPAPRAMAVVSLALLLAVAPARAQEAETDASDLPAVLKTIAELEKLLTDGVSTNNSRALRALQTAAASPKATLQFYLDAKKTVDFDETGKPEAEWRAWRDANEDANKDTMSVAARNFQLRYLILCLQATSGAPDERTETIKKLLPLLVTYLDDLAAKFPKLEAGQGIVNESALGSVFAKHLKLDLTMDKKAGWPASAGDVPGIYDRIILPYYREAGDVGMLLAAWDKRIAQESGVLVSGGDANRGGGGGGMRRGGDNRDAERSQEKELSRLEDEAQEAFSGKRLPELKWWKERDGLLYGNDLASSYAKLTQLLRANLDHPSAQDWLKELKSLADGTYGKDTDPDKKG